MAFTDSVNRVEIFGRITTDPTAIEVNGEAKGCRYMVACNRPAPKADQTKEPKQTADFIPCISWGWVAKHILEHYSKGDRIFGIGTWQSGSYTGRDGKKVYTNQCNIAEVHDMNGKSTTGADMKHPAAPSDNFNKAMSEVDAYINPDDLPF